MLGDDRPAGQADSTNQVDEPDQVTDPVIVDSELGANPGRQNNSGVTLSGAAGVNPSTELSKAPVGQDQGKKS